MSEKSLQTKASGERNLGIDLLRCVSMLLIVIIHLYNQGGVVDGFPTDSTAALQINYPMRLICMTGVNLFALISGYVMLNGRFRPGRLLELWLQVLVIGLAGCLVGAALTPELVLEAHWLKAIFPITRAEYWYFTAYTAVFALSPVLSRGIRALNARQSRAVIAGVFGLFSLLWMFGRSVGVDCFTLSNGNTTFWIVLLYILGAAIRQSGFLERTASWKLLATAAGCILILWGVWNLGRLPTASRTVQVWGELTLNFCNPLLLVFSFCVFRVFTRLRIEGAAAAFVKWLSPLTFGVYLIHTQPVLWKYLAQTFRPLGELRARWTLPAVIGAGLGLLLACACVDWLRSLLFRLCRVRKLCDRLELWGKRLWQKTEQNG